MHVVPPRLSGPASEPMRKPRRPASGNSTGVVREGEETGNDPDLNLAKYGRAPTALTPGRTPGAATRRNGPTQAEWAFRRRFARCSSRRFALILGELMLSGSRPPQPAAASTRKDRSVETVLQPRPETGLAEAVGPAHTRRNVLFAGAGVVALAAASAWFLSSSSSQQTATGTAKPSRKSGRVTEVPVDELMKPGPLPDLVLGKAERARHRRRIRLHDLRPLRQLPQQGLPALKEKYIDTGKVRFIMREFPLDNLAAARLDAGALRRRRQDLPAHLGAVCQAGRMGVRAKATRVPELFKFAKQAGFTQESFDKCLTDQKLLDDIIGRPHARLRDVRRQLDADLLHQRQEAGRRHRSRTSRRRSRRS